MKSVTGNSPVLGVVGIIPQTETTEEPKEVKTEGKQTPAKQKKAVGSKPKPAKAQEPKPKRDTRISIALTEDLAQAVKDEAWQQRKSVNSLLVDIIEDYLKKQQRKGK